MNALPGGTGSGASIAAIDAAALEARQRGHNLAGFRRLCNSAGYQFCARCRGCGQEVSVHRGNGSWWHSPIAPCPRTHDARNGGPEASGRR
jgi:hypothetical protein